MTPKLASVDVPCESANYAFSGPFNGTRDRKIWAPSSNASLTSTKTALSTRTYQCAHKNNSIDTSKALLAHTTTSSLPRSSLTQPPPPHNHHHHFTPHLSPRPFHHHERPPTGPFHRSAIPNSCASTTPPRFSTVPGAPQVHPGPPIAHATPRKELHQCLHNGVARRMRHCSRLGPHGLFAP